MTPTDILNSVAAAANVTPEDMQSDCRLQEIVNARIVFARICYELNPDLCDTTIGSYINRHRTSVIYYRKIFTNLAEDYDIKYIYNRAMTGLGHVNIDEFTHMSHRDLVKEIVKLRVLLVQAKIKLK